LRKDDRDGVKFYLDAPKHGNGADPWVLFRASGTERMLRCYVEAATPELVEEILEAGEQFVRQDQLYWIPLGVVGFIALYLILGSFFTVRTAEVAVITRFGKFLRVAQPGLNWKRPFFDSVTGTVSLRVNQITLTMETKTKDNVFVTIPISVQNRVRPEKVYDAYYKLSDPVAQIKSYVEQVILGHVPGMTLDEVFASQSSIAAAVKQELDADMATFGYEIVNVLVTDIVPDAKVKSAMNDINAALSQDSEAVEMRAGAAARILRSAEDGRMPRRKARLSRDRASQIKGRPSSRVCRHR
jgi:regulator of protease activity HflC (stomatin/prohibitin superfamily)